MSRLPKHAGTGVWPGMSPASAGTLARLSLARLSPEDGYISAGGSPEGIPGIGQDLSLRYPLACITSMAGSSPWPRQPASLAWWAHMALRCMEKMQAKAWCMCPCLARARERAWSRRGDVAAQAEVLRCSGWLTKRTTSSVCAATRDRMNAGNIDATWRRPTPPLLYADLAHVSPCCNG